MNNASNIPDFGAPFIDIKTGRISPIWWQFMITLFKRTGDTTGVMPASPDGADAMLLEIGQITGSDAALIERVAALEAFLLANQSTTDASLRRRVDELEQTVAALQPPPPINGTVLVIGKS
jgi:hypothetical protein